MHKSILAERDANAQQAIVETTQEIAVLLGIEGVEVARVHMRTDPILQAMLQREQIAAALKAIAAKLRSISVGTVEEAEEAAEIEAVLDMAFEIQEPAEEPAAEPKKARR
jgi:hypothetical protein